MHTQSTTQYRVMTKLINAKAAMGVMSRWDWRNRLISDKSVVSAVQSLSSALLYQRPVEGIGLAEASLLKGVLEKHVYGDWQGRFARTGRPRDPPFSSGIQFCSKDKVAERLAFLVSETILQSLANILHGFCTRCTGLDRHEEFGTFYKKIAGLDYVKSKLKFQKGKKDCSPEESCDLQEVAKVQAYEDTCRARYV